MRFDYTYDGTMRSFEDCLQRMDICFIHDIDRFTRGNAQPEVFRQAMDGCWKALARLRSEGLVKAIGVGVNEWEVCHEALKQRDFDCFLLAGRYTLLEQDPLDEFLPLCEKRNAAVVVGAGFNSGILATGAVEGARYNYAPAPAGIMERVRSIEASVARMTCRCQRRRCNLCWPTLPSPHLSPECEQSRSSCRTLTGSAIRSQLRSGQI